MEEFTDFLFDEWILSLAFIFITVLLGRSFIEPMISSVKTLNTQDAVRLINNDETIVVDVRLEREFKPGHIINSVHIPIGSLESRIRELDSAKDKTILIICQNGMKSKQAGGILTKQGFKNLHCISGGINAWINANFPITTIKAEKRKNKKGEK